MHKSVTQPSQWSISLKAFQIRKKSNETCFSQPRSLRELFLNQMHHDYYIFFVFALETFFFSSQALYITLNCQPTFYATFFTHSNGKKNKRLNLMSLICSRLSYRNLDSTNSSICPNCQAKLAVFRATITTNGFAIVW